MKKIRALQEYMRKASSSKPIWIQPIDLLLHKLRLNISPVDYYYFEFYKPGLDWKEKERYVALYGSTYWPFENNPFRFEVTLTNKAIQKNLLMGLGLPTPKLLATIGRNRELHDEKSVSAFISSLDRDVVIKPISSAGGKDIYIVRSDGDVVSGAYAKTEKLDIWSLACKHFERGLLIEERVNNIPELAAFNPDCLHTYRIVTIKTLDNVWHIAAASLKLGRRGSVADNNSSNNIQLNLREDGTVYSIYDFLSKSLIDRHPDTKEDLTGFKAPGLQEVIALAIGASKKFDFMGTIGWDIAMTPRGAMIIEGNSRYGCSSLQRGRPGIITDDLAKGLKRHHFLSRWNTDNYYPAFRKRRRKKVRG